MPEKAWAYYSSAADDEITTRENHAAYHRQSSLSFLTIFLCAYRLIPEYGFGPEYLWT